MLGFSTATKNTATSKIELVGRPKLTVNLSMVSRIKVRIMYQIPIWKAETTTVVENKLPKLNFNLCVYSEVPKLDPPSCRVCPKRAHSVTNF